MVRYTQCSLSPLRYPTITGCRGLHIWLIAIQGLSYMPEKTGGSMGYWWLKTTVWVTRYSGALVKVFVSLCTKPKASDVSWHYIYISKPKPVYPTLLSNQQEPAKARLAPLHRTCCHPLYVSIWWCLSISNILNTTGRQKCRLQQHSHPTWIIFSSQIFIHSCTHTASFGHTLIQVTLQATYTMYRYIYICIYQIKNNSIQKQLKFDTPASYISFV